MQKLLVVGNALPDDGPLRSLVDREGYRYLRAADADQALEALRRESPGCAVVEHPLPGGDGIRLIESLRQADPSCPVILVCGDGDVETAIQALRAGALDYLRSPIDPEQLRLALGRARERRPAGEPGPTVLVIEDHEPTRARLVMVLQKEGYQVESAADGADGLAVFQSKHIDVIVADLRMPRMSGIDVLRETKGKGADVEVIVITGYGNEEDLVLALREGAVNFLKKPVDLEQLLLCIQRALELQAARRGLARRNRDLELMQQLAVRLTPRLELVVEAPSAMKPEARDFLLQLVDSLPIGIVVAAADRTVLFANRHVAELVGERPPRLTSDWLEKMGVVNLTDEKLAEGFARALQARPGTIETITLSRWAFVVMTPLALLRPDRTELYVALAFRGERRGLAPGS